MFGNLIGIPEYLQACIDRRDFLLKQLDWIRNESVLYEKDASVLEEKLERLRQETIGYLLPELVTSYLQTLQEKILYPGLLSIKEKFDEKFRQSEARREELEGMDVIQHYDFHYHQAEQKVAELRPAYTSAKERRALWVNNASYRSLHKRGYFRLDYKPTFWGWFLDWRDVSFLMSHLSKNGENYSHPQQIKDEYRALMERANETIQIYEKRLAESEAIVALKKELEDTISAPERLLAELYQELGKAILEHFQTCPESLKIELAKSDPMLDAFFRKEMGMMKQVQYLRELNVTRVQSPVQQVQQEIEKLNLKIRKLKGQQLRRKRKSFTKQDLADMRDFRESKWDKRRAAIAEPRERINQFDRYDNGSFLSNYLWWDVMTNGLDGDDLFEVKQFRQQHPDWDHRNSGFINSSNDSSRSDRSSMGFSAPLDGAASALAASMGNPSESSFQDAS